MKDAVIPHDHEKGPAADCTNAQTCTVCGIVFAEALGHTTTAGTCTRCNETIGDSLLTKVSTTDQLVDGAKILITYSTNVMSVTHGGKFFNRETGFSATATVIQSTWNVVTLVKSGANWKLISSNGQTIQKTNSENQVQLGNNTDNSALWTITVSNGTAEIRSVGKSNYCLQYNGTSGQERFSCYKGTQSNPTLYIVNQ